MKKRIAAFVVLLMNVLALNAQNDNLSIKDFLGTWYTRDKSQKLVVKKKIITSYNIYSSRDTENAVFSMWNVIRKFPDYPEDLNFITDGNPIYNAAQLFFEMEGYKFDLHQVIGVKNKDQISKEFRPFKQIEERMNRSFKENYHYTNGYGSLDQANSYMVLYVAFFNFLRRHSSLGYTAPVHLHELDEFPLMTDKWLKLIELSQKYHPQSQN